MFISRKKHEAIVKDLHQEVRALDALAAKYKRERDAARIEAAANAEDAGKYRRSKANLKQFRKEGV